MRVEKCPICNGRGQVPSDFYDGIGATAKFVQCRSCRGQGYILVPVTRYVPRPYNPPLWPWPHYPPYTITWTA